MQEMLNWLAINGPTFWSYVLTFIMGCIFSAAPLMFQNFHIKMVQLAQISLVVQELHRMQEYVNTLNTHYNVLYANYEAKYNQVKPKEEN